MRHRYLPVAAAVLLALVAGYFSTRLGGEEGQRLGPVPPTNAPSTTVTRIVDGDTVILASVGKARLIGVDTPEVYGGEECFGARASAFTKRELRGETVRYAVGAEQRDRYGRLLVYLWLPDGRSFNALLLRDGYARSLTIAPNNRYARTFAALTRQARNEGRGLWNTCSWQNAQSAGISRATHLHEPRCDATVVCKRRGPRREERGWRTEGPPRCRSDPSGPGKARTSQRQLVRVSSLSSCAEAQRSTASMSRRACSFSS